MTPNLARTRIETTFGTREEDKLAKDQHGAVESFFQDAPVAMLEIFPAGPGNICQGIYAPENADLGVFRAFSVHPDQSALWRWGVFPSAAFSVVEMWRVLYPTTLEMCISCHIQSEKTAIPSKGVHHEALAIANERLPSH